MSDAPMEIMANNAGYSWSQGYGNWVNYEPYLTSRPGVVHYIRADIAHADIAAVTAQRDAERADNERIKTFVRWSKIKYGQIDGWGDVYMACAEIKGTKQ